MKKIKKLCCSILCMTLFLGAFSPSTAYAYEVLNESQKIKSTTILLDDSQVILKPGLVYTSDSFNVGNNQTLGMVFTPSGTSGTQEHYYEFSLQKKGENGWSTVKTYTMTAHNSLSTQYSVIPNSEYRIRAVTNDKYARWIYVRAYV